jgi:hypothetical protein
MRTATIKVDHDLPPRASPLGDESTSQVWGGCVGEYGRCHYDSDCCPVYRYESGGRHWLRCVRNSAHMHVCVYA